MEYARWLWPYSIQAERPTNIDGSAYVNTRCVYGLFLSYMQIETSRAEDPVDITRYTLWLSLAAATLEVWLPHTSSSVIFSCYYGDKFLKKDQDSKNEG